MTVLINLIRIILVLWIISVLIRWLRGPQSSGNTRTADRTKKQANEPVDFEQTGAIDDAEFEEIDRN